VPRSGRCAPRGAPGGAGNPGAQEPVVKTLAGLMTSPCALGGAWPDETTVSAPDCRVNLATPKQPRLGGKERAVKGGLAAQVRVRSAIWFGRRWNRENKEHRMKCLATFAKLSLSLLCIVGLHGGLYAQSHPAEVRIVNQSQRTMEVKVMRNTNQGALKYYEVLIPANTQGAISIFQTGTYYLKVKAEYPGRDPVYSMGDPFECHVGSDGYSVLTFTYTIDESAASMEGRSITRGEFEKDRD